MDQNRLMPLEEAQAIILEHVGALSSETVPLTGAYNRTLAADVVSDI